MLAVDPIGNQNMYKLTPPYCFEIVTKELTYYMGMEIPENGKARNKMMKSLKSKINDSILLLRILCLNEDTVHPR